MNLLAIHWGDPRVAGVLIILAILVLVRRWSLVLLVILLLALAQGLKYLLRHSSLGPDVTHGVVIGVYVFGGILLLFLAIAQIFTRRD